MQRSDGGHYPASSTTKSRKRGSNLSASSKSASPDKKTRTLPGPPHDDGPDEEEEKIEDADGTFAQDQEDSDIQMVSGSSLHRPIDRSAAFTSVADRTRNATRQTGSASPTRAVVEHVGGKGKSKAAAEGTVERPTSKMTYRVNQSTGSSSPQKEAKAITGVVDRKGKGKAANETYVEIDKGQQSNGDDEGFSHLLTINPTKQVIAPSGVLDTIIPCETKVLLCQDMKGAKRKMRVRQVELHNDGIALGETTNRAVFIHLSNIIDTKVRSTPPDTTPTERIDVRTTALSTHYARSGDHTVEDQGRLSEAPQVVSTRGVSGNFAPA